MMWMAGRDVDVLQDYFAWYIACLFPSQKSIQIQPSNKSTLTKFSREWHRKQQSFEPLVTGQLNTSFNFNFAAQCTFAGADISLSPETSQCYSWPWLSWSLHQWLKEGHNFKNKDTLAVHIIPASYCLHSISWQNKSQQWQTCNGRSQMWREFEMCKKHLIENAWLQY